MDHIKVAGAKIIGPGGMRCPCCRPKATKGIGWKTALNRRVRHSLNNAIRKAIWDERTAD